MIRSTPNTQNMAPKKTTKGEVKKSKPKGGIKKASAVKVMKDALGKDNRLSENAVAVAIRETERCLTEIAKNCKTALEFAKRKTLNHEILLKVSEQMCIHSDSLRAIRTARVDSKRKGERNVIAKASVARVVKQVLGSGYRLSATALDAFSLVAEAELTRFAASALAIIQVSNRTTVKERDLIAVVKVSGR